MNNITEHSRGLQKRTKEFTLKAIAVCRLLPNSEEGKILGKQLLRSATSVGANTRAAFRSRSAKEFIAKAGIIIEEADECEFWLEIIEESNVLNNEQLIELKKEAAEITAIFVSIVNKAKY